MQPSILAAASNSRGTVRKKGRKTMTANGNAKVVSAIISAGYELTSPMRLNKTKSGVAMMMAGSSWVIRSRSMNKVPPRKFRRASA